MADPAATPFPLDGATRLFGIVGDPIVQTMSPQTFTPIFHAAGKNAVLLPFHVPSDRFVETMRGLMQLKNLDGFMVTYPFKAQAAALVDKLLPNGKLVGAINTMRREPNGRWTGEAFDGKGLVGGLAIDGVGVAGKRVLLLGAGGAGSAVAFAFAESGVQSLTIFDVDQNKARDLVERVIKAFPACETKLGQPVIADNDILVNATPVGMLPTDGLPADLGKLKSSLVVTDIVPKPETPLIAEARSSGCKALNYLTMAKGQISEIAKFLAG